MIAHDRSVPLGSAPRRLSDDGFVAKFCAATIARASRDSDPQADTMNFHR